MTNSDDRERPERIEFRRRRRSRNIALGLLLLALVALFYALTIARISESIDHPRAVIVR